MSKDAAYATSQARGRGNKATQLGPGTFVTCKATHFGEEYAKDLFGRAWRGARLSGVVEKPVGKHLWSVWLSFKMFLSRLAAPERHPPVTVCYVPEPRDRARFRIARPTHNCPGYCQAMTRI